MKKYLVLFFLLLCFFPFSSLAGEPQAEDKEPLYQSVEERRIQATLQQERKQLFQEYKDLDEKKKELKRLEVEVDKKLDELKTMRQEIENLLVAKEEKELIRLQNLSKMYEKISPEKAARIFSTLEEDLVIDLLEIMKTKSAARILNNMDQEKAAKLTTAFSQLDPR